MKLALVGYGKMARTLEDVAIAKGAAVVERITRDRPLRADASTRAALANVVLVDFSTAAAVPDTVRAAAALSLDLVIGTTGWADKLEEVQAVVDKSHIGVVHAANFSVGMNIFYRLVEHAARAFSAAEGYDPFIFDWHHRFKVDSPSGTALEIQRRMALRLGGRNVAITCQRAGYVPSLHAVGFDSEADTIHLEHRARTRQGLAEGALLAARWVKGRRGLHTFDAVIDDLLPALPGRH